VVQQGNNHPRGFRWKDDRSRNVAFSVLHVLSVGSRDRWLSRWSRVQGCSRQSFFRPLYAGQQSAEWRFHSRLGCHWSLGRPLSLGRPVSLSWPHSRHKARCIALFLPSFLQRLALHARIPDRCPSLGGNLWSAKPKMGRRLDELANVRVGLGEGVEHRFPVTSDGLSVLF